MFTEFTEKWKEIEFFIAFNTLYIYCMKRKIKKKQLFVKKVKKTVFLSFRLFAKTNNTNSLTKNWVLRRRLEDSKNRWMREMGRNCCCINGLWLKGPKARPNHSHHHNQSQSHLHSDTGLGFQCESNPNPNCNQTRKKCLSTTGANGFSQTNRFCVRNNNRKMYLMSNNNHSSDGQSEQRTIDSTKECFMYLILFLVAFACFVNSLEGDFVHDDIVAIINNPDVQGKTSIAQLFLNDFWGKPMADPGMRLSLDPLAWFFTTHGLTSRCLTWNIRSINSFGLYRK